MFADADLQPDYDTELDALYVHDMKGDHDIDPETGDMIFYRKDGRYYEQGHGRNKCSRVKCCAQKRPDTPYNCGFNSVLWKYPEGYQPCGDQCSGAFCRCIRERGKYKELQYSNL